MTGDAVSMSTFKSDLDVPWRVGAFPVQDAALQHEEMECRLLVQGIEEISRGYSMIRCQVCDAAKKPMWCNNMAD